MFSENDVRVYADRMDRQDITGALANLLIELEFYDSAVDLFSEDPEEAAEAKRQALIILKENTASGYEWICTRDILLLREITEEEAEEARCQAMTNYFSGK